MECDVCYTEYNLQDHEPRVLPCGHTTCKHCVAQMRASHLRTACPHCRQEFDSAKVHPNFALINVRRRWGVLSYLRKACESQEFRRSKFCVSENRRLFRMDSVE